MLMSVAPAYRRARFVPFVTVTGAVAMLFALIFSIALVSAFCHPTVANDEDFIVTGP